MTLKEIIREKLTDYAEKYGLEAGFDLLLMELEAEAWEVKVEVLKK
jgi:hypothetical protein